MLKPVCEVDHRRPATVSDRSPRTRRPWGRSAMFRKKKSSFNQMPRFCPDCVRAAREDHESNLCADCGYTLIPQGYCPICESYWRLALGDPCPKDENLCDARPP